MDIFAILQEAQDILGSDILLTAYGFNVQSRTFFLGFGLVSELEEFNGGVLIIEEDGSFIDVIELPFIPTYFIRPWIFLKMTRWSVLIYRDTTQIVIHRGRKYMISRYTSDS